MRSSDESSLINFFLKKSEQKPFGLQAGLIHPDARLMLCGIIPLFDAYDVLLVERRAAVLDVSPTRAYMYFTLLVNAFI